MISCDFDVARANGQRFEPKTGSRLELALTAHCTKQSLYEAQIERVFFNRNTNLIDYMCIVTEFVDLTILCI